MEDSGTHLGSGSGIGIGLIIVIGISSGLHGGSGVRRARPLPGGARS
jgi:hypothetical protein